ncbi:uncharacterized protein BT62DRAFT_753427 [Guyanagaster necrorhizus]|uniref:Wax synthase domain-containing protein n=1 Tax=Guyanagaster necrorhizus TaxID=856835 RepID=A0A9P8AUI7_9AGAR|nr:uncharacterized protein BT62DRAFT_753427 [Guyanagaster necrorhizus MCA 3950]KAG7448101.1 hypothetical protein BT62DRAFT_753427 [Guyanagaster necrorhizus MCA 3950]
MHTDNIRPPFPLLKFLVLPDLFLAAVLAIGLPKWARVIYLLGFVGLTYRGLQYSTGPDKMQDYAMGSTLGGQLFTAIHLLLLAEPIIQYRHFSDTDDPQKRSFLRRVYWAACIIHSPRGIGWNYEVSHVPPRPAVSHGSFICSRLFRILVFFFFIDAAQTFRRINPLFSLSDAVLETASVTSQGFLLRCPNIIAWMAIPYAGVQLQYHLISVISVALGFSMPSDWPAPYGRWSDAYTVRDFWGRTWHQMLRRYASSIGKFVSQAAGFKRGSFGSSYMQLIMGFCVSGLMHIFGDAMVEWRYLGSSLSFFLAQPVAIVTEDAVIGIFRRADMKLHPLVCRSIGYAWVFAWLNMSFPWYIDWALRAGLGRGDLLPVTPLWSLLNFWKEGKGLDTIFS